MIPVLETPTFEIEIYSKNLKVEFRPFLVKEEKLLIMAQESGNKSDILKAMQDVITACSKGAVNGKELPFFDLQNIFVKLRSQSIGGSSEFNLICGECSHRTPFELDLSTIELQITENHSNKIQLTDDIGVIMKYPAAETLVQDDLKVFDIMVAAIDAIYTKEEIFSTNDEPIEEVIKFVDGLTSEQFEKISEFFKTAPRVEKVIEYKCPKCETENVVVIDGLESFFG